VRTLQGRDARCRTAKLVGLRPVTVAVPSPAAVQDRLEVAVELAAEANRTRRTVLVREAAIRR
jgi:hypothetical protein